MKTNQNKALIDFLEKHKEINKTNVSLLDKEITEEKIYELRAYTEGKLSHLSFGRSIKGCTDQKENYNRTTNETYNIVYYYTKSY